MEPNQDERIAKELLEGIGEELAYHELLLGIFADVEAGIRNLPEDKQRQYLVENQFEGGKTE